MSVQSLSYATLILKAPLQDVKCLKCSIKISKDFLFKIVELSLCSNN